LTGDGDPTVALLGRAGSTGNQIEHRMLFFVKNTMEKEDRIIFFYKRFIAKCNYTTTVFPDWREYTRLSDPAPLNDP
jgi:hypothetical protein